MSGNYMAFEEVLPDFHLKFSIARLEMSRLIQQPATARDPVRNPVDHLRGRDFWVAEEAVGFSRVVEQSGGAFFPGEARGFPEAPAEFAGDLAHRQFLRARYIQNARRRFAMSKGLQAHGIRITLPNHIYRSHA